MPVAKCLYWLLYGKDIEDWINKIFKQKSIKFKQKRQMAR